ncbi:MAG: phage portal protein, partial [Nitrosarchaeum sp.]
NAFTKIVPEWIFGINNKLKLAFLRGFLDADGTVDKFGRITYYSANKKLLNSIRHLCMGLGIPVTNLRFDDQTTPFNVKTEYSRIYRFTCSDPKSNLRIGSRDFRYISRLKNGKPFNRKGRAYPSFGGKNFHYDGLGLSRINKIELQKSENVYDLEIEDNHNFIANGVIVHNSTNNNIEFQGLELVIYTLRPWLVKFEQEYTIQLLTEKERKKYFYEHLVDGLLRGDPEKRHKTYAHGRQWGYYSINDIRRKENLNSIGPEGDKYLVPMNMVPIDKMDEFISGKNEKQNNNPAVPVNKNSDFQSRYINKRQIQNLYVVRKRIQGFYSRIFSDSINTILNRESLAIQRAFKKHRNEVFSDWINSFFEDHYAYVRKIISPVILSFSEQIMHQSYDEIFIDESERNLNIESIVEKTIDSFVSNHISKSQDFFRNIFSESNDIQNSIEKYIENRCNEDSEKETFRICNIICNFVFQNKGMGSIIRIVSDDPCDNCKDLDCKPVNENEINNYCCCIVTG